MSSNRPPPTKLALKPSLNDGNGNHIHNKKQVVGRMILTRTPLQRDRLCF